ncbi:hypothetical protein [Paenibacillus tianjinensis]|uniref:Uncharacterized protein n=1 Tax=Paenibacillus tianjinensis TaxID=2810347 RepID=A0ABX7L6P5_9BACL|nr:hypothetical protein [Paenibacillus tianjinensis]QSF43431.1 hypothetical protein JRJ22_19395 [Paenibacillus tianjinensis]
MKSRKYSSFDEAINDLKKSGELTYFGREGVMAEGYVYQYRCKGIVRVVVVYEDGNLVVVGED